MSMQNKKFQVYAPVAPLTSFTLENLGKVSRIAVNGGGGMGGSQNIYYGELSEPDEDDGLSTLSMIVSGREIRVNVSRYVSTEEVVMLWRATTVHQNENFKNKMPMVQYFVTHPRARLDVVQKQHHEKSPERLFGLIDPEIC